MAQYHRRKQVCHTRPAYREGRKEKAVKVYTINDESRYLLMQGVPALKLTKELLDQCSLYGAIQEYRLLDDFPDKEEFTEVYWIQYQQLQAARVAKRKLDDKPFYGGILHVTYAPEYETVNDTRLKLQDRRKAIAKRIRVLEAQQKDSAVGTSDVASSSRAPGELASTSQTQDHVLIPEETGVHESLIPPDPRIEKSWSETSPNTEPENTTSVDDTESDLLPQIPLPPQPLPRSEWTGPAKPSSEFPRLSTAHATLPVGFNPYPHGKPIPNAVPKAQLHSKEIGPQLPLGFSSNVQETESNRDFDKEGAKPKTAGLTMKQSDSDIKRLGRKRQSSDIYQSTADQQQPAESDLNLGCPRKQRALDRCSFPSGGAPNRAAKGPGFVPRKVQQQKKFKESSGSESCEVATTSAVHAAPSTGDNSLDNTVQDIRNRMRAVAEAGSRASQPLRAPSNESNLDSGQPTQRPLRATRRTRRKI